MEFLLIILGFILTLLFFLNIKSAADILCRIAGGFALLIFYNMCAPVLSLAAVGVNIFSALICGKGKIVRGEGIVFLAAYAAYIWYLIG